MKTITDIKEANTLLQIYTGATLEIVMYSINLKRIALRLILPNVKEVIYIIGIGCESLDGRFNYKYVNLNISVEINHENNDSTTIIRDKSLKFILKTSGGFTLVQGIESEFGTSFDDFIKYRE
ncbi:conserved hypothetical protein [Flavobacterium sp. 9AF]|uniref:hypothetical protein n=1 Tax=Flavobacterium sp. 9AF TaxID=2653142 RepID=UPI0012F3A4C0|nr:hypothetical protein [Flavobacterium sp. 9AF]VXB36378.1 conserved hypothetical protein [Flavobacterium sp. 9AF]